MANISNEDMKNRMKKLSKQLMITCLLIDCLNYS